MSETAKQRQERARLFALRYLEDVLAQRRGLNVYEIVDRDGGIFAEIVDELAGAFLAFRSDLGGGMTGRVRHRGTCWSCRQCVTLRSDGTLRRHRVDRRENRGTYCPGGNCLPLNAVVMG